VNDGPALERTLADLSARAGAVQSMALVPVGLTRFRCPAPHQGGLEGVSDALRPYTAAEAAALLDWAVPRQRALRRRLGQGFLYLADEFYLLAGQQVPTARLYDGFPQLENGVGLVRHLLDDWARLKRRLQRKPASWPPRRVTLVSGTLAAPLLEQLAGEMNSSVDGVQLSILAVENNTFGPTVTVSGLLTGEALRAGLRGQILGDVVFLPRVAFDLAGERTLDDVTVAELEQELGRPIVLAERMSEVAGWLARV
jgi:NifB/MoaA-like Fe-S oxidoreductase